MHRRHTVGALGIANVEQFARKHPALGPPRIRIDERSCIARRSGHHIRRFLEFLLPPQILRLGKDVGGVLRPRTIHLRQLLARIRRLLQHGGKGLIQRCRAGKLGDAPGRLDLAFIKHGQHPRQVILARNDSGKLLEDHGLLAVIQLLRPPEGPEDLSRGALVPAGHIGARKDHHAFGGLRRRVAKSVDDHRWRRVFLEKRPLGIIAEGRHAGPARQFGRGLRNLRTRYARRIGEADRPSQYMPVERLRRQPVADAERPPHIAGGQRV